ncbi:apolipoprotein N-acyltransferase [Desulfarculus baarsii DSM 2075]|uniref:Apolipoprotein N-acyltransferase n=1 Tax=Desulfarculus baarsii (strain ATCC 33931 / DSM 2075 / LMG 7858 / VKM B-1802 / 2st14) TaxID=644282 RepID=E1QIJ9_DESB2|nr:apolipoprotein N-acyltransferase [Desulfarculus baarsii]ADK84422.1 apolipoprotein N-acyltransferase [Desulfarculus baarsii DSM 2075]
MKFLAAWRPPFWAVGAAAIGGPLTALGFPPHDIWPLTLLGVALLASFCWLLPARRAFAAAWLFGLGCAMGMVWWLTVAMTLHGGMSAPAAWAVLALCMAVLTSYPALAVGLAAYARQAGLSPLFCAPLAWVGGEWLRGVLLTGFPWLPLASGLTGRLELAQTAEWWGASGVSFLLVLTASLLARGLAPPLARRALPGRREWAALGAALALVAGGWLWGQARMTQVATQCAAAPKLVVGVVQPDVAIERLWRADERMAIIGAQAALSRQASAAVDGRRPWLVVWPESSTPFYFAHEDPGTSEVLDLARELDAFVMPAALGLARRQGKAMTSNRAWLVGPDGRIRGYYDKAHLVPFGEYVPLGEVLFWVRALAQIGGDQAAGRPGVLLEADGVKIGALICYESIFAYLGRAQRLAGATLLVNQTNDAWYGPSGASAQHMSHLVFRCIENRLACARSANTGVSGFVLPDGRMAGLTDIFQPAWRVMALPLAGPETTFFTRHGDLVGPICAGAMPPLWAVAWLRRRRDKRRSENA